MGGEGMEEGEFSEAREDLGFLEKNSKRVPITLAMNDILLTHKPRAIALLFSWENGDLNQTFKLCFSCIGNTTTCRYPRGHFCFSLFKRNFFVFSCEEGKV